jgi:isoleucyl-tRNA synthetase
VLALWREQDVFARSLASEGAPGLDLLRGPAHRERMPGTHHVEARVFKDIFPRYRTMKGLSVRRKGGLGLPRPARRARGRAELGLDSKADIEAYGIEAFNAQCRESVLRYVGAFEELTDRIGFWIDTDDAYRTMDATYVDSCGGR